MTTVEAIPSAKKKIVLSERPPPKLRRWFQKHPRLFSAIALGLLVVLISGIWRTRARGQQGPVSYHTVKRGDFPVSIIEGGALRAVNEVVVRNELEGMARIISIIAEGTQVKKGELLVQLDATDIQEHLGHGIELILDGGVTLNEPSTVLDLTGPAPVVLRAGKGRLEGVVA